jgi:hypothetical protein
MEIFFADESVLPGTVPLLSVVSGKTDPAMPGCYYMLFLPDSEPPWSFGNFVPERPVCRIILPFSMSLCRR